MVDQPVAIKADKDLRRIPVVILTTSEDDHDVLMAYELHANCFITNPVRLERFLEVVRSIEDFWLTIVRPPPNYHQPTRGLRGTSMTSSLPPLSSHESHLSQESRNLFSWAAERPGWRCGSRQVVATIPVLESVTLVW